MIKLTEIKSPADIKGLSMEELKTLAADMRVALLERLSRHGGHVGPNLGFVEATLALHYVFNSPKDKIIFDVSHQCYPHKMLTGRMAGYIDPAHYDDISGYTNPGESPHDFFTVGHTSTSVSLACGLAKARDLEGRKENIIAVIGDGSLSGGEAFEGLDNAATLRSNFIVVVNDNDMSIAENHGGLYDNLKLLRTTCGEAPVNFFKALGFDYRFVGQGNDPAALIAAFEQVKDCTVPTVVHVVTDKGHGYAPAEADKEKWHYETPFDVATGTVFADRNASESYSSLTAQFLLGKMKVDPTVVAVNAATPAVMGFTPDLRKQAGDRFIDVGIAEEHAAALSSGLAKGGMNPFWGVYSTFVQRAYDQISQDICINSNSAVIAVFGGGVRSMNDVTHLCWFDIPLLSNIPNLVYLAPADRKEYLAMADWALRQRRFPVAIRVPSAAPVDIPEVAAQDNYDDLNTFSQVVTGHGVAIVAVGNMLTYALEANRILRGMGYEPTVINPRFVSGLDAAMLSSLSPDHDAVLTVEDGILDGGFGQKVSAFYGDTPMLVRNLGLPKEFMDRYDIAEVATRCRLTAQGIADAVVEMFK